MVASTVATKCNVGTEHGDRNLPKRCMLANPPCPSAWLGVWLVCGWVKGNKQYVRRHSSARRPHAATARLAAAAPRRTPVRQRPVRHASRTPGSVKKSSSTPWRTPAKELRAKHFLFDSVLGPDSSQTDVFHRMRPLVDSCLDGRNAEEFGRAYGVVLPRPGVRSPRVGVFAYVDSWK
jgi:hypothetical protein